MSDEKDLRDDETSEPNSEPPAAPKRKSAAAARRKSAPVAQKSASAGGMLLVVALAAGAAGAAGGWFGHDAQAKAKLRAESAAPAGSGGVSGPCGAWQTKICAGAGDNSAACGEAKSAVDLLTAPACDVALASVPATLAKVKAERATCDKLIAKLCADLPPGSQACEMVKERTPSFPRERCEGMLEHYDEVIGGLKQMDQQMGATPMGAAPPGAAPPGAAPPGAAPPMGAAPHIQIQPAPAAPPAHS